MWDLEKERPERRIKLAYETKINDLCIIPCINLIAVVQERKVDPLTLNLSNAKRNTKKKNTINLNEDNIKNDQDGDGSCEGGGVDSGAIVLYDFFKGEIVARIKLSP